MRIHQWLKNLLLFVPLLTAFFFSELSKVAVTMVAFFAFSFIASATYIVNDLMDLENDRTHPRKRFRPFASARVPILHGVIVAGSALALGLVMAYAISREFFLMVLIYLMLTSAYSWVLKKYVLIDVLTLSILYTLRILSGSVAIDVATSSWLLAFSVFLFLSLALIKRCAELILLEQNGVEFARGRDYRVSDLRVLWPMGVGAALSAVVVFGLFISVPETRLRYATPQLLWLLAIGLIYWLARLWVKTSRGEMHDDPMIYAIKDRGSCITIFVMTVIMVVAHSLALGTS
jgi:4-hydroxybenzoate polyprenyltransferase